MTKFANKTFSVAMGSDRIDRCKKCGKSFVVGYKIGDRYVCSDCVKKERPNCSACCAESCFGCEDSHEKD